MREGLPQLISQVKNEGTRYNNLLWQALCQKLMEVSEGEKRQAIRDLGATDLVRDNYDDSPSLFIEALTKELKNFQLHPIIGQRAKDLGAPLPRAARDPDGNHPSNFSTFYKKIKDYLEFCTARNLVSRPIIRGFVYGSFGVLAQSLDDLVVTFIALSCASHSLTIESAELVHSYLLTLPAGKKTDLLQKVRSSLLDDDNAFFTYGQPFLDTFNGRALRDLYTIKSTEGYKQNVESFLRL